VTFDTVALEQGASLQRDERRCGRRVEGAKDQDQSFARSVVGTQFDKDIAPDVATRFATQEGDPSPAAPPRRSSTSCTRFPVQALYEISIWPGYLLKREVGIVAPGVARWHRVVMIAAHHRAITRRAIGTKKSRRRLRTVPNAALATAERELGELQQSITEQIGQREAGSSRAGVLGGARVWSIRIRALCVAAASYVEAALAKCRRADAAWSRLLRIRLCCSERAGESGDVAASAQGDVIAGTRERLVGDPGAAVLIADESVAIGERHRTDLGRVRAW